MLKKNKDLYKEKYKNISKDQQERIASYLLQERFSQKDLNKFDAEFHRILKIKHEAQKLVFYIIPEVTPRPRINFHHGNFYVKNAASNNKFVKLMVDQEDSLRHRICTPCTFECKLFFPIPSTMNRVDTLLAELGVIRPQMKKDWDNLGKTYSDMVQKWLLMDDSLIYSGTSQKYWSLKPRVEIIIDYLIEFDCKFNKRLVQRTKAYKEEI